MSRVQFWAAGNDGCMYYRCRVPADELARRGHDVHVSEVWADAYPGKGDGWYKPDVLVGQRVTNPGPSTTWQKTCRNPEIFCVYELDDDLFNIDPSSEGAYAFFSRPDNQRRIRENIEAADAVTVSTQGLADQVYRYNKNVTVVPNTIPGRYMIHPVNHAHYDIGWSGSTTHAMDWEQAAGQVRRWLGRNQDASMLMIGADYGKDWGLSNYRYRDWITPVPALWDAFDFRVGLAPLRPHRFNRSKSHVKALEYAARGIPVLASDTEPYRDFVDHENSGILIKRDHEWGKWLTALVHEPSHAATMGRAAFKRAEMYATESWGGAWCDALGLPHVVALAV